MAAPGRVRGAPAVIDVGAWLRGLGLGQYEAAFRDNAIDADLLMGLTAEDLKELGVTALGHRKRLLEAIAALHGAAGAARAADKSPRATPAQAQETEAMRREAEAPAGAERRHLTVLFCDLVGSTALSARLDPEDLRAVVNAYHRAVAAAVGAQGGYVAKLLGDGVLAYFGWPRAQEDDPERAVRVGLAAVDAVARLRAPDGGMLAARAGIATGPVVVGEVLGEGTEARERGVVGETPNLAARLQVLAECGAVVTDEATRRLTGGLFAWEDLGEVEVRGLLGPVRAWRALGESGVESRFEALRSGGAAPMVGREEELELLLRRWRRAAAGEGQVVLLRGEAGIGKSRLTAALQEALAGEEHETLVLFCSPQHADSALWPVVGTAGACRSPRAGRRSGRASGSKLEALLLPLDPPAEDVALVADLLSVDTLGRWPTPDPLPKRRRERLLHALVRRVSALAARRPVLAVVEDVHWVDPSTREFIDLLVAQAADLAFLLVATHRPEFDASAWLGLHYVTPVQLNRLAPAEHRELLRRLAGGKALPPEVEAEVLAHTDGVPLFVEEVCRAVLEFGLLREEAGRWALEEPLPRMAVPATLQASLAARLDRLSSVREVAQAGAVLGREFACDLLTAVADLEEPVLYAALLRLEAAGLLQRRGEPPDATYVFKHALIRDAAHAMLLREPRRALHARAAAALEELRPELVAAAPQLLAHHLSEAGEAGRAAALYLRASEVAASRSALAEAVSHATKGLAQAATLPAGGERRSAELGLQLALGKALAAARGYSAPETGAAYARALELCRVGGDRSCLASALYGNWIHLLMRAEHREAAALADEMFSLGEASGNLGRARRRLPRTRNVAPLSWPARRCPLRPGGGTAAIQQCVGGECRARRGVGCERSGRAPRLPLARAVLSR